jgi:hypothetical protein
MVFYFKRRTSIIIHQRTEQLFPPALLRYRSDHRNLSVRLEDGSVEAVLEEKAN